MACLHNPAHKRVAVACFAGFNAARIPFFEGIVPGYLYTEIIPAMAFFQV